LVKILLDFFISNERPLLGSFIASAVHTAEFKRFFDERSGPCENGLYPTVTIRQIMWALKMKPIPKQRWETVFDRRDV